MEIDRFYGYTPQSERPAQPQRPVPQQGQAPAQPQRQPGQTQPQAPQSRTQWQAPVQRETPPVQEAPAPQRQAPVQQEAPTPAQNGDGKKPKKEKTVQQQLTRFGIGIIVLCFFLSLIAGAGGALVVDRLSPLLKKPTSEATDTYTEGQFYQLPEPTGNAALPIEEPVSLDENLTEEPASEPEPPAVRTKGEIYADAVNSIVGIRVVKTQQTPTYFGRYITEQVTATGSGFFVTQDGYIVTNYHVIEGATEITVTTYDGSAYTAALRGSEEANDIAVLKISGRFTPVVIGSSAELRVGDDILVIGNPLGSLSYTFTDGVVSYLNRMITGDTGTTINMFQTNAAINAGNSGGPVYNMNGEVVGIASAKYAASAVEGLGFCIPIDDVYGMITDIVRTGYVTNKPVLGVSVQTITEAMSERYALPVGCYVVALGEDTPAAAAGIQPQDVITALNGTAVTSAADMSVVLRKCTAGQTVSVRVERGGQSFVYNVTLGEYRPGAARTQYTNVYDF